MVLGPDVDVSSAAADHGVTVLRGGTLSKALGSLGGFVAGPGRRYIDLLRNRARPFIFTTAPTPADVAAAVGCRPHRAGRTRVTCSSPACAATSTARAPVPHPHRARGAG